MQASIAQLSEKLQRLLDSYLDGDVERELYQAKRAEILGEKKLLQEQIEQTALGVSTWVEPMKQWIETAVSICKIAKSDDLLAKKALLLEIFGSNLKMRQKEVVINDDQFLISPLKNRWQALRAAKEKTAPAGGNFRNCTDLVSHMDITWNSFLPYLVTFADRLEGVGFRYVDGEVFAPKEEISEK